MRYWLAPKASSLRSNRFIGIGIPFIYLKRWPDRLSFTMGIFIPIRRHLLMHRDQGSLCWQWGSQTIAHPISSDVRIWGIHHVHPLWIDNITTAMQSIATKQHISSYNDVIMRALTSQITSLTTVYSTVYSRRRSKKKSKLRVTGLCAGNSPVTGEFPAQRPVTRKMFPFDDVIMLSIVINHLTWMDADLSHAWTSETQKVIRRNEFSVIFRVFRPPIVILIEHTRCSINLKPIQKISIICNLWENKNCDLAIVFS